MIKHGDNIEQILDVVIDKTSRGVWNRGEPIKLTPKEYELLCYLAENKDKAVSRDEILRSVWGYASCGSTRTVDVHIQRLRKKLHWEKKIQTVFKYGYRVSTTPVRFVGK